MRWVKSGRQFAGTLGALVLMAPLMWGPSAQGSTESSTPMAPKDISGTVISVVSGERIKVRQGRKVLTVTLSGVDAPVGRKCYASQSKAGLITLVPRGSRVKVKVVTRKGRKVQGQVLLGTTDVNAAVVERGLAESDGTNPALDAAAATARSSALGLHRECGGGGSTQGGGDDVAPTGGGVAGDTGSTGSNRPGDGSTPTGTSYTAAEKEEIRTRYQQNLVGLELNFSTGDGTVTDTYGISFCNSSVYSLFQITSFSGSGSTSSQHAGTWRITDVGGVPRQSEIVRVAFTPGEAGREPFFTDIAQVAGGQVLVNNRPAGLGSATRC